jgi:hypothetical protein
MEAKESTERPKRETEEAKNAGAQARKDTEQVATGGRRGLSSNVSTSVSLTTSLPAFRVSC